MFNHSSEYIVKFMLQTI